MSEFKGRSINSIVDESLNEIENRRLGITARGLATRWTSFNSLIGGGFQPKMSYLFAGLSGSGKSTIANIIETDLFDYNPDRKILVLNFNFETPSVMNLAKKYSADVDMTVSEIMSAQQDLSEEHYNTIKQKAQRYRNYNIYYYDVSGTYEDIADTVIRARLKFPEHEIVSIIDHTQLVTAKNMENEIQAVTNLANMTISVKKQTNSTFILLGQLNSNIEQIDRLMNPSLHVPMRSDLFGGKAVYSAMDTVVFPHRPEYLKLSEYTMLGLPVENKIYFHVDKQRYGDKGTIQMDCSEIGINKIKEIKKI